MLHRKRDCCSNADLFEQSLEELKVVLLKNGYPKKLVENKIKIFLSDDQKPDHPDRVHTLCLNFNAFSMEPYINSLLRKMKNIVPEFLVNIAYKSIPVSNLFSTNSKASIPYEETSNVCYQFRCDCSSHYIGHTSRPMIERIGEHQRKSTAKGIYYHILTCPEYLKKQNLFRPYPYTKMTSKQRKFAFFKSQFKILQKSFRSNFERRKTEAFYIRVKRPDLNDQKDHHSFKLF